MVTVTAQDRSETDTSESSNDNYPYALKDRFGKVGITHSYDLFGEKNRRKVNNNINPF